MDKKRLEEDIIALVFSLFFVAFMYFFISPNLTGFVIYEPSYSYNASEINLTNGVHKLQVKAKDKDGHESEHTITIGVNTAWDATPTP